MQNQHTLFIGDAQQDVHAFRHVVLPPPQIEPSHDVFSEAMLEEVSDRHRRSAFDWVASAGVHFAVLVALFILPLYFTSGLDVQKFSSMFLAPPVSPPAGPPPMPIVSTVVRREVSNAPTRVYVPGKLTAPTLIPAKVDMASSGAVPLDDKAPEISGGVLGGIPGGQIGGTLGEVLGLARIAPAPSGPAGGGPKKPVQVGGNVKPPRLIYGAEPEYPSLARHAHISGVVVIEATIDEHGNVIGMRALSGHPLLIPAALAAVSKRKYEPTILDNEPTPIDLRVEVDFKIT